MRKRTNWGEWRLVGALALLLSLSLVFSYGKRVGDWQWEARVLSPRYWYVGAFTSRDPRPIPLFSKAWNFGGGFFEVGVVHWVPGTTRPPVGPRASTPLGTER